MKRLERIMALLNEIEADSPSQEIKIAKGFYKYPYSLKAVYSVEKRHLKYKKRARKNS